LQRLFAEQLPVIERAVSHVARRNALSPNEAEEFGSWARVRLMDRDFAILGKFRERSSISTYLATVLGNLYHDYRNHIWGKWRASAAAERLGPIAMLLEKLVWRDGYGFREAIGVMRSRGVTLTDMELARMYREIPTRAGDREVSLDDVDPIALADDSLAAAPSAEERELLVRAVESAVEQLSNEDKLITRMRFWDGRTVAEIARALCLEQRPLYRRIEAIKDRLRETLMRSGIDDARAREILGGTE
jgi:RNA polymerase sigma factor for flagellar operon FliA